MTECTVLVIASMKVDDPGTAPKRHRGRTAEGLRTRGEIEGDLIALDTRDERLALLGFDPGEVLSWHARAPSMVTLRMTAPSLWLGANVKPMGRDGSPMRRDCHPPLGECQVEHAHCRHERSDLVDHGLEQGAQPRIRIIDAREGDADRRRVHDRLARS